MERVMKFVEGVTTEVVLSYRKACGSQPGRRWFVVGILAQGRPAFCQPCISHAASDKRSAGSVQATFWLQHCVLLKDVRDLTRGMASCDK
jgi:hypothetical protein